MQTNVIPTSAPGDRAPKMTNQHTKLDQAMLVRTEAPSCPHASPAASLTRCKPVICAAKEPPSPRTSLTCAASLTRAMHAEPALCHLPSIGPTCSARPCAAWSRRAARPCTCTPSDFPNSQLPRSAPGFRHNTAAL
eukprot:scaffold10131_cov61-Phaeocystis_antarctica.AAC.1